MHLLSVNYSEHTKKMWRQWGIGVRGQSTVVGTIRPAVLLSGASVIIGAGVQAKSAIDISVNYWNLTGQAFRTTSRTFRPPPMRSNISLNTLASEDDSLHGK